MLRVLGISWLVLGAFIVSMAPIALPWVMQFLASCRGMDEVVWNVGVNLTVEFQAPLVCTLVPEAVGANNPEVFHVSRGRFGHDSFKHGLGGSVMMLVCWLRSRSSSPALNTLPS